VKSHPLDVLKVLRDRLKIDEKESNRKMNLIQDAVTNTVTDTEDTHETVYNSRPNVMIVDDDNDALFTIGEFVKELDCSAIFAHNGMECLSMLNHVKPDLIFLDIMMPQMDGFETIKRIRNEYKLSSIPVVALTAYAMLDNKDVVERNGFSDLVTKPISSQSISSCLRKYIRIKTAG